MKKITLWLIALFTCWQMTAQVNVVENFNPSTNLPTGWTSNGFGYVSGTESCAGNSYIDNLYSLSTTGSLETPNQVAGSNGTDLTVAFDYKIEDWNSTTATTSGWGNIQVQYSTNNGGAWTTFFTINDANHVVTNTCATFSNVIPAASLPSGSDVKLRFLFTWVSGDYDIYIDNFSATQVSAFPPSCTVLSTPVSGATNISSSTVAWNVAPGIPSGYKLSVGTTSGGTNVLDMFDVGNVTSYNLGALLAGTTYYVKVFPYNANGQATGCTESSFTTCGANTTYPSIELFNTFLPNQCWMNGVNGDLTAGPSAFTASGWAADGFANSGTTGAFSNNIYMTGANDWVITPQFSIPASGYELKFDAAAVQYAATTAPTTPWESDDFIEVLVSSTGTSNWTVLHTYNDTNQPGITATPISLDLDAFASQTVRFAFRAVEGTTNGDADIEFSIDNFQVRLTPSCIEPLGLLSAGITSTGASVSWDATNPIPSSGYEYIVSTSNTLPTIAGTPVTTTFAVLSGLLPNTTYYLFVRANCGSGDFSPWSDSISFTTSCAPVTSFNENFDGVTTPALPSCWSKILSGATLSTFASVGTSAVNSSAPNGVDLYNSGSAATDNIMLVSPTLSNLSAGTHRLKFKARNSTATQDLEIGVLTDPTDATTFTLVEAVDITTTFQNYVVNFDAFTGPGAAIALRRLSTSTYTNVYLDDIVWEAIPTCPDQTGLIVAGISATGANTSWDNLSNNGVTGYEYAITTSLTPPASGTATTATFYIATGLTPQTVYYLHVRAACTGSEFGTWSTIPFTTGCLPVTTIPWTEGFEGLAVGNNIFPSCWGYTNITSNWNIETTPVANTGVNSLGRTWSTNGWAFTPTFTLTAGTSYRLSYYMRTQDTVVGYDVTTAVGIGQSAADMTTILGTPLTGYQGPSWNKFNFEFTPTTTDNYSFGVHVVAPNAPNGINFDDFRVELTPTCPDQTGLVVGGVSFTGANTSWDNLSTNGAMGYEYAVTTSATPPTSGTATTSTFYVASGLTPQTVYYLHVRAACTAGAFGNWSTISFFTGYCLPSSTGNATYVNNFSTTGGSQNISNLATGFTTGGYLNASTQFVEGFATSSFNFNAAIVGGTAGFSIWIDWNNDMVLDNATEKVYNTTSYGNGPFSGSITIPVGTAIGNYRMRIMTDWNASNPSNPCAAVTRGEYEDYTISVIAPPACAPPAPVASGVADMIANINWPAVTSAALGYEYVLNTVATDPTGSGTAINGITYAASALTPLTTYYFHVRSVCAVGTYSTWNTVTFTTLATPPANDNCANATVLTPGAAFATNPLVGTNIGSTASTGAPDPGCASYSGGDVWYSVVVPASGSITFDSASVSGSPISDSGMAVYSGPCSTLVLVECDDDDSANGSFSKISLTNRTPGEVLYVRFWEYGNNAFGTFQVSAYDASLSNSSFDSSNFVAYPNPVKDVLNLSYKTAISNVKITNLLGQEVLNSKTNSNDVQVNMAALTSGAYIVNITVEDSVHTIKVIKE